MKRSVLLYRLLANHAWDTIVVDVEYQAGHPGDVNRAIQAEIGRLQKLAENDNVFLMVTCNDNPSLSDIAETVGTVVEAGKPRRVLASSLSRKEKALVFYGLDDLDDSIFMWGSITSIYRITDRAFDLVIESKHGQAWLPLAVIRMSSWVRLAQMSDYPHMVSLGDWSGIRDSSKPKIWAMFRNVLNTNTKQWSWLNSFEPNEERWIGTPCDDPSFVGTPLDFE